MISLRFQGVYGTLTQGSVTIVNGNAGTFQLQNNALIGYSLGGAPLNVGTGNGTLFINTTGLSRTAIRRIDTGSRGRVLFLNPLNNDTPVLAAAVVATPPAQ